MGPLERGRITRSRLRGPAFFAGEVTVKVSLANRWSM
jgi:hypothetical protein